MRSSKLERRNIQTLKDPHFSKESFRVACKRVWRAQSAWDIRDHKITMRLKAILSPTKARHILIYSPMPREADIRALIKWLRPKAKLLAPITQAQGLKIAPYRLPLQKKCSPDFRATPLKFSDPNFRCGAGADFGLRGGKSAYWFWQRLLRSLFCHPQNTPLHNFYQQKTPLHAPTLRASP
ncbi:hypothetical protein HBZS_100640 [Helicobacter bizzozeronii CCUG 35545]|nr:hypothetical protein HBZS_100640 [Helicobacter bizzozeronii CCUG 35545]